MANVPYGTQFYTQKTITATNTNTSQNINVSSYTSIPLIGNVDTNYDPVFFTPLPTTDEIEVLFTGRIRVTSNVHYYASRSKIAINTKVAVNGVLRSVLGGGGYIRNSSGQRETLSSIVDEFDVVPNDKISIMGQREGGSGTSTMHDAGSSIIIVEKVLPND